MSFSAASGLGERLIEEGLVQADDIRKAEQARKKTGEPLGTVLVNMGLLSEEKLLAILAQQLNIPRVSLRDYLIDPEIVKDVPERVARQHKVMPLFRIEDTLTVAMADPLDVMAVDDIRSHCGCEVESVISSEAEIQEAIAQHYGTSRSLSDIVESIEKQSADFMALREGQPQRLHRMAEEPPVVRLVNTIMIHAIGDRASDIHLEPTENDLRVRFRVDGLMHEYTRLPRNLQLSVLSRVKIMANIDISERRLPKDGRIELRIADRVIDMRVATYPSIHGEKIAIRILDKATGLRNLDELGFGDRLRPRVEKIIQNPYGLILIVGPTGSGKTTSLYALLRKVRSEAQNTMTIEDPVEYQIEGLVQAQVNVKAGLTFAEGLRAIVRQDPDVIMIGEIRDLETAEIAVRAALTGHLVFSTLHTNDASSTITRLSDMGLDSYLIASSLTAVIAQRLVREVCPNCKESYAPPRKLVQDLRLDTGEKAFYRGRGCNQCSRTGYRGRLGLFELMEIDPTIQELILFKETAAAIKKRAKELGMRTLREDGLDKAQQGLTTLEEVARATFGFSAE